MSIETISLTIGEKVPTAIYTSSAEPVCIVDAMGERKDDAQLARRLVACWNACIGIPTDVLEQCKVSEALWVQLTAQRDELLAAIEQAASSIEACEDVNEAVSAAADLRKDRDKVMGDGA